MTRLLYRASIAFLLTSPAGMAQYYGNAAEKPNYEAIQADKLKNIGIDQKLDAQVPLDLVFEDEWNHKVQLKDYIKDKPVVLALAYYECPMLCNLVLNGILQVLRVMSLEVGKDFEIVTVSFDPREHADMAAAKKKAYLDRLKKPGAEKGWHFLTGKEPEIKKLTGSVGFRYAFDDQTNQFAHASGIMVLTPEGRLSKYFYGIEYSARDLRLGLVEASHNKIGSPSDQLMLLCFHYNPNTGKYSMGVITAIRTAGVLTVLGLATMVIVFVRRDRRQRVA